MDAEQFQAWVTLSEQQHAELMQVGADVVFWLQCVAIATALAWGQRTWQTFRESKKENTLL